MIHATCVSRQLVGEIMGGQTDYFWVVLCKNKGVHNRYNLFSRHCIPLSETDAISPPPDVNGVFKVRCDDCGHEYAYRAKDLLRAELESPESFHPHPLFEEKAVAASAVPTDPHPALPGKFLPAPFTNVLGRIRTAVSPYLHFRQKGG